MALTANALIERFVDQEVREYAVEAAKHVFKGGLVGKSASGHAQPLVAGGVFLGIAYEESDNSGGVDGDTKVRVFTVGDFAMALSGATVANIGNAIHASADDTLTFTEASNSFVGICVAVPSGGQVIVRINVGRARAAALTAADAATVDGTYGTEESDVITNNRARIAEIEGVLRENGMLP